MDRYGFTATRSYRKLLPAGETPPAGPATKYGIGVSTPLDMVRLLDSLDAGKLVSPAESKHILEVLGRQRIRDGIGRHETHPVASKSGALDALRADVGIISGKSAKIALAITVDGMPRVDYSADNAGNILISQLTAQLVAKLGPLD